MDTIQELIGILQKLIIVGGAGRACWCFITMSIDPDSRGTIKKKLINLIIFVILSIPILETFQIAANYFT